MKSVFRLTAPLTPFYIYNLGGGARREASESEVAAYLQWINHQLEGDRDLADILPLSLKENEEKPSLFKGFYNGLLLAKIVNKIQPGLIDESLLNKNPKSKLKMIENHNLALEGARKVGINIVNIDGTDLMNGTKHLILGITWQLIKAQLFKSVGDGSSGCTAPGASPAEGQRANLGKGTQEKEQYLIDWFNGHLSQNCSNLSIANFGKDIADARPYAFLLHALFPELVTDLVLSEYLLEVEDPLVCADRVLQYSQQAGIQEFLAPSDITSGNKNLNMAFTAMLFNVHKASDTRKVSKPKSETAVREDHQSCNKQIAELQDRIRKLEEKLQLSEEANTNLQEQLATAAQSSLEQRQLLNRVESERDASLFKVETLEQKLQSLTQSSCGDMKKEDWDRQLKELESSKRVALAALQSKLEQANETNQGLQIEIVNVRRKRDETFTEVEAQNLALREKDDFLYRLRSLLMFPDDIKDEEVFRNIREWEDSLEEVRRKVEISLLELGILTSPTISKSTITLGNGEKEKQDQSSWTVSKQKNMGTLILELAKKTEVLTGQLALVRHGYHDRQNKEEDARDSLSTISRQIDALYRSFKTRLGSSLRNKDTQEKAGADATALVPDSASSSSSLEVSFSKLETMQAWVKEVEERLNSNELYLRTSEVEEQRESQYAGVFKSQLLQVNGLLKSLGIGNLANQQNLDRQKIETVLGVEAKIHVDQLFKVMSQSLQKLPSGIALNSSTQSLASISSPQGASVYSLNSVGAAYHCRNPVARNYMELLDIVCHQQLNLINEYILLKVSMEEASKSARPTQESAAIQGDFANVQKTVHQFLASFRANGSLENNEAMLQFRAHLLKVQKSAQKSISDFASSANLLSQTDGFAEAAVGESDDQFTWIKTLCGLLDVVVHLLNKNEQESKLRASSDEMMNQWTLLAASLQQSFTDLLEKVANNFAHYSLTVDHALILQEREGMAEKSGDWGAELSHTQKDAQLQNTVLRSSIASLASVNLRRVGHRPSVSSNGGVTPFQTNIKSLKDFLEQLKAVVIRYDTVAQTYQKLQGLLDNQFAHNLTFASELSRAVSSCYQHAQVIFPDRIERLRREQSADDAESNSKGIIYHLDCLSVFTALVNDLSSSIDKVEESSIDFNRREQSERDWHKQFATLFSEDFTESVDVNASEEKINDTLAVQQDLASRLNQFYMDSTARNSAANYGLLLVRCLYLSVKRCGNSLQQLQELQKWKAVQMRQLVDMEEGLRNRSIQVKDTYESKLQECVKQINDLVLANERGDQRYQALMAKFETLAEERRVNALHWGMFNDYLATVQLTIGSLSESLEKTKAVTIPPVIKPRVLRMTETLKLDKTAATSPELAQEQRALEAAQAHFTALSDMLVRYDCYCISLEAQLDEEKHMQQKLSKKADMLSAQSTQAQSLSRQMKCQVESALELVFSHLGLQLPSVQDDVAQSSAIAFIMHLDKELGNLMGQLRLVGSSLQDGLEHAHSIDAGLPPVTLQDVERLTSNSLIKHIRELCRNAIDNLALQTREKLELKSLNDHNQLHLQSKDEEVSQFEKTIDSLSNKMEKFRGNLGQVREQKLDLMAHLTQVMGEQDRIVRACDQLHQSIQSKLQQHRTRASSTGTVSSIQQSVPHQRAQSSTDSSDGDSGSSVSKLESSVESMLAAFQEQSQTVQHVVSEMVRISGDLEKVRTNYIVEVQASKNETSQAMTQVDSLCIQLQATKKEFADTVYRNKERTKLLRGLLNLAKKMTKVFTLSDEQRKAAEALLHVSSSGTATGKASPDISGYGLGFAQDGAPTIANLEVLVKLVQNLFDSALETKQSYTRQITVMRDALEERDGQNKASCLLVNKLVSRTQALLAQRAEKETSLQYVSKALGDSIADSMEKSSNGSLLLSSDLKQRRVSITPAKAVDESVAESRFDIYSLLVVAEECIEKLWSKISEEHDKYDLKIQELQYKVQEKESEGFQSVKSFAQFVKETVWLLYQIRTPKIAATSPKPGSATTGGPVSHEEQANRPAATLDCLTSEQAKTLQLISNWTKAKGPKLANLLPEASALLKKEIKTIYKASNANRSFMEKLNEELAQVKHLQSDMAERFAELSVFYGDQVKAFSNQLVHSRSLIKGAVDQHKNRIIGLMNERNRAQWQYETEISRQKNQLLERSKLNEEFEIMYQFLCVKFRQLDAKLSRGNAQGRFYPALTAEGNAMTATDQSIAESDVLVEISSNNWSAKKIAQAAEELGFFVEKIESKLVEFTEGYNDIYQKLERSERLLQESHKSQHNVEKQFELYKMALAQGLSQTHSSLDLAPSMMEQHSQQTSSLTLLGGNVSSSNNSRSSLCFGEDVLKLAGDSAGLVSILQELEKGVRVVRTRCTTLEGELKEARREEKQVEYVLEQTRREYQKLSERCQRLSDENSELSHAKEFSAKEADCLQQQAKTLESECHRLLEEKNDLKRTMNNLQFQLANQTKIMNELERVKIQVEEMEQLNLRLTEDLSLISFESSHSLRQARADLLSKVDSLSVDSKLKLQIGQASAVGLNEALATETFVSMTLEEKKNCLRGEVMVTNELLHGLFEMLQTYQAKSNQLEKDERNVLAESEKLAKACYYVLSLIRDDSAITEDQLNVENVLDALERVRAAFYGILQVVGEAAVPECTDKSYELRKRLAQVQSITSKCQKVFCGRELLDSNNMLGTIVGSDLQSADNGLYDPSQIPWNSVDHLGYVSESKASESIREIIIQVHKVLHNSEGSYRSSIENVEDGGLENIDEILEVATAYDSRLEVLRRQIDRLSKECSAWHKQALLKQIRVENLEAFIDFIQSIRGNFEQSSSESALLTNSPIIARLQRMKREIAQLKGLVQSSCNECTNELGAVSRKAGKAASVYHIGLGLAKAKDGTTAESLDKSYETLNMATDLKLKVDAAREVVLSNHERVTN